MKAWRGEDTTSYEGGCTIVFAETRGKAHALALDTECCDCAEWNDVRVTREPAADKLWKPGKKAIDWRDKTDRVTLVKECDWTCLPDYLDRNDCVTCPAKEWCGEYERIED
jgi:hypothetical protein